jgi:hypothetical protein
MKFELQYQKYQLPFHKKESKYYRIQRNCEDTEGYKIIEECAVKHIYYLYLMDSFGKHSNYRLKKIISRSDLVIDSPTEPGLYLHKAGKYWISTLYDVHPTSEE